ncbi:MAG: hypothetical protein IT164_14370 [Bryobacterales bacterium]|nr:hypothetical protein [Bryobacterales bacterium]
MLNRRSFFTLPVLATFATRLRAAEPTRHTARVTKLFRSPDGNPNALETVPEGFWLGEQITDNAYLLDHNGKVLRKVPTESSNTSGIAFGGGYLWMAANGKTQWRTPRPTDATTGEIVKADPRTGKTIARYPIPGGGGVHGIEYAGGKLWITSLKLQKLSVVDPKDFSLVHQIPVHLGRAHGLGWDHDTIWCMHSNERQIHKLSVKDGALLEIVQLGANDPDPHGMCLSGGKLYYCDAGIAPTGKNNASPHAGWVCRIDIV